MSFQGKSARSKYWLKLDVDWAIVIFKRIYPYFYKSISQEHVPIQSDNSQYCLFQLTMKKRDNSEYILYTPNFFFQQKDKNSCWFTIRDSSFVYAWDDADAGAIAR